MWKLRLREVRTELLKLRKDIAHKKIKILYSQYKNRIIGKGVPREQRKLLRIQSVLAEMKNSV